MSFVKPVSGVTFESTRQGFLYALSRRESSSNLNLPDYDKANITSQKVHSQGTRGYIGYFQFGEAALYDVGYFTVPYKEGTPEFRKAIYNNDWVGTWTGKDGVHSKGEFLTGRKHQLVAINFFVQRHCSKLRELNINEFYGKIVKGIELTESGCCAGAHLVGAKYVLEFAKGEGDKTDGNRTPISEYINLFANYDLESCCNRKIYIQVVKDKQPVEGKQVTVETEYDGKFHVGKLTNKYTTNAEGKIPVIVRHPGAKIKITVDGKNREIVQEADKKQSYIINLTDGVTVTAPLEKSSNPKPKPKPNQTPQEARNEQNSQSDKLSENENQDVNFNIIMVEGDTKKPIINLKFFVTYKGKAKDKRTDNTGAVKGLVATTGQDIEISMQGDNTLQPIHHFKVSKELEGSNVEVPLPVEGFTIKVVNHKSEPVKNTNFMLKYRGRSITKRTDNNGNISTKMLVGFVYKFCLANGQELITRRCLKGSNEKITINEVAYNLSQGKSTQSKTNQENSFIDTVFSFVKDNIPSFSLPSPTIVAKPSQSVKSSQVQKPPTTKPVAKAKPPAVKQNNTHTEKNGKPLTVVTKETLASDTVRYHIYHTGEIKRENGKATGFAEFIYYDKDNKVHNLGKSTLISAPKRASGNVITSGTVYLIDQRKFTQYRKENIGYKWTIGSANQRYYLNGITMAAVLGVLMTYNNEEFVGTGFSNSKGESVGGSKTHRNGEAGDFRYLATDKSHRKDVVYSYDKNFDLEANTRLANLFKKFGFTDLITGTKAQGGVAKLPGTRYVVNHHHHIHIGKHNYAIKDI